MQRGLKGEGYVSQLGEPSKGTFGKTGRFLIVEPLQNRVQVPDY